MVSVFWARPCPRHSGQSPLLTEPRPPQEGQAPENFMYPRCWKAFPVPRQVGQVFDEPALEPDPVQDGQAARRETWSLV